jgi:FMN reductase
MSIEMSAPIRILGIGGSIRETSNTRRILETVLGLAREVGAETQLLSVRDLNLPMFDPELPFEQQPHGIKTLVEEAQLADAFIIASPTYHGTVSGAVKNVLDALDIGSDRERVYFDQRPVGLLAYGGPSALNVINALYHSVRGLRGMQVPTVLTVNGAAMNPEFSAFTDVSTLRRAETMIQELLTFARLQKQSVVTA